VNCLEFRREKLAEPRRLSPEARAHTALCPACTAFAWEVDEAEQALDRALLAPVPDGLADRIIFQSRRPRRLWRVWALAASVVLATTLGFNLSDRSDSNEYARLAIEHVVMEPESFSTERNADVQAFRAALLDFGGDMDDIPGTVRYVRLCPVDEGMGWHIVLETEHGLATLFLVSGKRLSGVQNASSAGWSALARPVPRGYYAVVTAAPGTASSIDRIIRDRIDWKV
jgi:hypothetical protein